MFLQIVYLLSCLLSVYYLTSGTLANVAADIDYKDLVCHVDLACSLDLLLQAFESWQESTFVNSECKNTKKWGIIHTFANSFNMFCEMTLQEAIEARHSVRAYKELPLAEDVVKVLKEQIAVLNIPRRV